MTSSISWSQKDANEAITKCIPDQAWKSAITLIEAEPKNETLCPWGTGTLFRVADESFLVTAGHVAKDAVDCNTPLCVPTSGDSFVQLHGNWFCSTDNQYGISKDPFDIAVLKLTSEVVEKLAADSFLRLNEIDFEEDLSKGIFALFGYPSRLSTPSTRSNDTLSIRPFQFVTYAYEGLTDFIKDFNERLHLLLSAKPTDMTSISGMSGGLVDRNGNPIDFPKGLGGISGCSVWRIGRRDRAIVRWAEEKPKIVAVQTGVYEDSQIIKATRWIGVSTLMHSAFPELRAALDLWHVG